MKDKSEDLILELKGEGTLIKIDGYSPLFFNDVDVQKELKQTCNMKYLCLDLDEEDIMTAEELEGIVKACEDKAKEEVMNMKDNIDGEDKVLKTTLLSVPKKVVAEMFRGSDGGNLVAKDDDEEEEGKDKGGIE